MKNYIKVIDHDNLYRDENTGAIINTDRNTDSIKKINSGKVIKSLKSDVECLKNELSEIKNLLREILTNGK
jgi:hypothetical protein